MRRWVVLLFVVIASAVGAAKGKEFTLELTSEQWHEIGNPAKFEDDLLVLQSGEKLWGRLKNIPTLRYSFAKVDFTLEEVAGVSCASAGQMQVVTRNGQNFIGSMPDQPLNFEIRHVTQEAKGPLFKGEQIEYVAKRIPANTVNFILLRQRGESVPLVHERFHSVILANGDRFPVIIATNEIHISDGATDSKLNPKDIVDVRFKEGLQGYIRGEGVDIELHQVTVKDKYLPVRLAKNNEELKLPWSQITRIKGDMGQLILTTPYQFTPHAPAGMVYIPAGRFVMGPSDSLMQVVLASDSSSASIGAVGGVKISRNESVGRTAGRSIVPSQEAPSYVVEMPAFFIDQREVTNREYLQFVTETGRPPPQHWVRGKPPAGLEDHPVVCITYADAESYARWIGKRLPTEIEWERAAKGGAGTAYPYGDNFVSSLGNVESTETRPAGSYAAATVRYGVAANSTAATVADMSGNVSEWTSTPFRPLAADSGPESSADRKKVNQYKVLQQTHSSAFKVVRGGSFLSSRFTATTTHRSPLNEREFNNYTGFRCVADEGSEDHSASGKRE